MKCRYTGLKTRVQNFWGVLSNFFISTSYWGSFHCDNQIILQYSVRSLLHAGFVKLKFRVSGTCRNLLNYFMLQDFCYIYWASESLYPFKKLQGEYNYGNLSDLLGDGIFAVDGEKWRHQRKVSSYEFSTRVLRDFSSKIFRKNVVKLAKIIADAANSNQIMDIQVRQCLQ